VLGPCSFGRPITGRMSDINGYFYKELIELLYLLLLLKITAYINQESLNVKEKRILYAVFKTLL